MKVLIDTNFFLLPNQFGIDIFQELGFYDLVTLSSCMEELKRLSAKKSKDGMAAKIALKLIGMKDVDIVAPKAKNCDKAILDYAAREDCMVATNDKALIKALKSRGVKIIRLKQKKYLTEE